MQNVQIDPNPQRTNWLGRVFLFSLALAALASASIAVSAAFLLGKLAFGG